MNKNKVFRINKRKRRWATITYLSSIVSSLLFFSPGILSILNRIIIQFSQWSHKASYILKTKKVETRKKKGPKITFLADKYNNIKKQSVLSFIGLSSFFFVCATANQKTKTIKIFEYSKKKKKLNLYVIKNLIFFLLVNSEKSFKKKCINLKHYFFFLSHFFFKYLFSKKLKF